MRKTKKSLLALALAGVMGCAVACGDGGLDVPGPGPGPGPAEETYTVTFMDGDIVVATYTGKKAGDKVAVPTAPTNADARYTFTGWSGLDLSATEVTVYASDTTYTAQWNEMFGSNKVFGIMQRDLTKSILIDGTADDAWDDATSYDLDENGSTAKFMWDNETLYLFADIKTAGDENEDIDAQAEDEEEPEVPGDGDGDGDGEGAEEPEVPGDGEGTEEPEAPAGKLIVTLDLLHSAKLASDGWDGRGWGGPYRGEPGPMVEGGYTITAGTAAVDKTGEWLSLGGYGSSDAKSVVTDDGYTVEFKIDLTDNNIGEYKPYSNQSIGLAVRTEDGASKLETFNGYGDHGPKSLSNMVLLQNEANADIIWNIKEVRETYDVEVDGDEDALYRDATVFGDLDEDGYTVKALWTAGKVYLYAELAETTESLEISAFGSTATFEETGEKILTAASGIALQGSGFFTVKVNGVTTIDGAESEGLIVFGANDMNFGRHLYEAKRLAEGATITVDGDLDEAYGDSVASVNTVFQDNPTATGAVYIRWDDEYLYVFVEVTDSSVCTERHSDTYHCDSVELSIDTCQTHTLETPIDKGYGNDHNNRPNGDYEGEGHFRMNPWGEYSWQGWIWMGDDTQSVFGGVECTSRDEAIANGNLENGGQLGYVNKDGKEWSLNGTAAKFTDKGYNVEYKMAWKSFGDTYKTTEEKIGQEIGFMININDANDHVGGNRNGVMSLNSKGGESWQWSGVHERLILVAADEAETEA